MLMSATVVAFAAQEEYLSDLRLIYANSYMEAKQALANSKLQDYRIYEENLNMGTGEIGVWLAYKTTTDVNNAITDIAVMQMGGGYSEGNYQQMIKKSRDEYLAIGDVYIQAIDYFAEAYMAGNFLAESAYRQLNFYSGLDVYVDDRLGDLFLEGALSASDLATLFMQGNSYVLENIRSLLAMGVSYNEDGKHYLEKVGMAPKTYRSDIDTEYTDLAKLISPTITVFRNMFEELSAYEHELNYEDDVVTDLELKYVEYKAMADMMRSVNYNELYTLYDFCMEYSAKGLSDETIAQKLYPFVDALNEGQLALTQIGHFYDVVRYSMTEFPEEMIDEEISKLEERFAETAFDVYAGVDRDMYKGTFALTSAAYRADAYTGSTSLGEVLFGDGAWQETALQMSAGAVGAGLFVWAIVRSVKKGGSSASAPVTTQAANGIANLTGDALKAKALETAEALATQTIDGKTSYGFMVDQIYKMNFNAGYFTEQQVNMWAQQTTLGDKLGFLKSVLNNHPELAEDDWTKNLTNDIWNKYQKEYTGVMKSSQPQAKAATETAVKTTGWGSGIFTGVLYVAGALSMAYSAISLYNKIYDYYHPTYDVIPEAMVDLIDTADGDRYIKYDVVTEITMKDGAYPAGDLNAFSAQRWNALYYTKSYEAGKPLLADFVLSKVNNRPEEGYLAVHRFGEEICYDLNKYNFSKDSDSLFLSIRQSENQKTVVAEVPTIIGSLFGNGILFLAGGVGLAFGIGGTVGLQSMLKKKKKGSDGEQATA